MNRKHVLAISAVLGVLSFVGCVVDSAVHDPGASGILLLSFDDRNFAGWEKALPLFAKYGAHATFFVSGPIDGPTVSSLERLSAAGHSVGLHGLRHANADAAIAKDGAEKYYVDDIVPQHDAICRSGIPFTSFAYPNCRFSEASDALFQAKGFRHVRGGVKGATPYDPKGEKQKDRKPLVTNEKVFLPAADVARHFRIDTILMGESYHTDIDEILACLERAAERKELVSITSHNIAPDAKRIHMKTAWLEAILKRAQELKLPVVGFDELPYIAQAGSSVCVDAKVPAGNIVVEKIEGDTVFLHQDLRDTDQDWIYWKFRVTGAAGRTLHFKFTKSHAVGSRSAAVSADRGKTWTWGDDLQPEKRREPKTNDHPDVRAFSWTFGPKDGEVWFSQTIPYDAADWRAFLDRHAADRGRLFEEGVLCKSRKGRDVEYARFGRLDGRAPYRIFVSSRHHCAEATATFVLEGLLEQVFASGDLGAWLRENVEFRVVPFVDKDGVVDGDQGKRRKPHDHARDYNDMCPVLYPEVRAVMTMLREWKPTVVNDFHCPWLRGTWFEKNNANEFIYQVGIGAAGAWEKQQAFGSTVERVQEAGFDYRQADDFRPGQGWNSAANWTQGMPLIHWAAGVFTNAALLTTFEIPFANQRFKTLYPADFRAFGRDVALAYRVYLGEHLPKSNNQTIQSLDANGRF